MSSLLQNWNAYIGRLGRKDFCFNVSKTADVSTKLSDILPQVVFPSASGGEKNTSYYTVGVMLNFTVDKSVLQSTEDKRTLESSHHSLTLFGSFTGSNFTTQIKGTCTVHVLYMYL